MSLSNKNFFAYVQLILKEYCYSWSITSNGCSASIRPEILFFVLKFLKNHSHAQFTVLCDVSCVDFPFSAQRFCVVYQLLSVRYSCRITLKTFITSFENLPSVTNLFASAGWFEREIFDLFGICFSGHSDLRRLLTDYGFEGYPLRKDFPLAGFIQVYYDSSRKRVICKSIDFSQEFRSIVFRLLFRKN